MPVGDAVIVLLAVLATIVTAALLVSFLRGEARRSGGDRSRVDRRRPVVRRPRDAREALALVGNALAATHDPRALLPVVLEVTVEATGAVGGRLRQAGREVAWQGHDSPEPPLELPLGGPDDGEDIVVELHPPEGGFSPEAAELARWLASQAGIAIENARLHHLVQRQATTDELTGLANRRRFMEALDAEIARLERFGGSLALVLADVDDFKRINDRFGHHVGDAALRAFAGVLAAELRDVDVAARIGGEEFALLLPGTDLEGGSTVARRVLTALAEAPPALPSPEAVELSASFGVAEHAGGSAEALLRRADAALYSAKARGKRRVEVAVD